MLRGAEHSSRKRCDISTKGTTTSELFVLVFLKDFIILLGCCLLQLPVDYSSGSRTNIYFLI
jgi:hypothetical protein